MRGFQASSTQQNISRHRPFQPQNMTSSPRWPSALALFMLLLCQSCNEMQVCRADSQVTCKNSDRKALLDFKDGLNDPEDRLISWKGQECCKWRGVTCDNRTGAVISIDIRNPYPNSFLSDRQNRYGFWNLSGIISPSLVQLKSLRILDLSANTFDNIEIPEFIGSLKSLRYLNISHAGFAGTIPPQLGNISNLEHLDVSSIFSFSIDDFSWVSGLRSLKYLGMDGVDLSLIGSDLFPVLNKLSSLVELHLADCSLSTITQTLPLNFSSLEVIDLSDNSLNTTIPDWFLNLTNLVHLSISSADLYGLIPLGFSDLPHLRYLDLSNNNNLSADCTKLLGKNWKQLEVLHLSFIGVHGKFPESVGNMTSLTELHLRDNIIEGGIPSSIGKLRNLHVLDLAGNNLTLGLPNSLERNNLPVHPLSSLTFLGLNDNKITGKLPEWLGKLVNLQTLELGYNSITGPIPSSLGNLSLVSQLGLEGNVLTGSLPLSFGMLSNLEILDVSSNSLTGIVSELHFAKLDKLKILHMSHNSLVINVSSSWKPLFQIRNLGLGSCQLGLQFPAWLRSQKELKFLDLSNTSISDVIPNWFWDLSSNLSLLNVSFNNIRGQLPDPLNIAAFADIDMKSNLLHGPIPVPSNDVALLDLSSNQFSGTIPPKLGKLCPSLVFLSLANNSITGRIPTSIGELQYLSVIQLSKNELIGLIPSSLQNCSHLKALDLEYNNISGGIPSSFSSLKQLQTLHLSNNKLSGEIPESMRNCSRLETLDLGYNRFSGNIPMWIGESLLELRILRLRVNKFSGLLPSQLPNINSLQVLDLAENDLEGPIPSSFSKFKAMIKSAKLNEYLLYGQYRGRYYEENLLVSINNQEDRFSKTLSLVTCMDLSGNNLSGNFPTELTYLSDLIVLNLSRNHITGNIPEKVGIMRKMISLDLSSNQFSGSIPTTMSSMSFLSYLNLSNNNLSGMIPAKGQLGTFNASAFSGNPYLCGLPLEFSCQSNHSNTGPVESKENNHDKSSANDKWLYLSISLGFIVGILGPFAVISIRKPWSEAYFNFIDWIIEKTVTMKNAIFTNSCE